ncbi:MAG: hypothetical protein V1709_12165, partial [Planctomycetota bacterium]
MLLNKFILLITIVFIPFLVPTVLSRADEPAKSETIEAALTFSNDWAFLSETTTPLPTIGKVDTGFIPLPNAQSPQGYRCSARQKILQLDVDGDGSY